MDKLYVINQGLNNKFPEGVGPFKIITRLAEECGELATQVNHFEDIGIKREKHGDPSREMLAKEVQDVLRCALQIAAYYAIEAELIVSIEKYYQAVIDEGLVETGEQTNHV